MFRKKEKYQIVSLGINCEPSFRCSNFIKNYSTFPFSWVQINDLNKFLDALDHISEILTGAYHYYDDLVIFDKYNIGFHLKDRNGNIINQIDNNFDEEYSLGELNDRFNHLIEKWIRIKNNKICFLQTLGNMNINLEEYSSKLYEKLSKHFSNFIIILILNKKCKYKNIENSKIIIYKTKMSPLKHQISKPKYSDCFTYWKILRKYSTGSTLRYLYFVNSFFNKLFTPVLKCKHHFKSL